MPCCALTTGAPGAQRATYSLLTLANGQAAAWPLKATSLLLASPGQRD